MGRIDLGRVVGNKWYTGTDYNNVTNPLDGDMFLNVNTAIVYQYQCKDAIGNWEKITEKINFPDVVTLTTAQEIEGIKTFKGPETFLKSTRTDATNTLLYLGSVCIPSYESPIKTTGEAGQVLKTNGSTVYWGNNVEADLSNYLQKNNYDLKDIVRFYNEDNESGLSVNPMTSSIGNYNDNARIYYENGVFKYGSDANDGSGYEIATKKELDDYLLKTGGVIQDSITLGNNTLYNTDGSFLQISNDSSNTNWGIKHIGQGVNTLYNFPTKKDGTVTLASLEDLENIDLSNVHALTATEATKALQDGEGRNIYNTYATKDELANAELGTGSTPADEIYLRLDGGNINDFAGITSNTSIASIDEDGSVNDVKQIKDYLEIDKNGNFTSKVLKAVEADSAITATTAKNANQLGGITATNILYTGTEGLTSTVNNAKKAEEIIGVAININDENAILLNSRGLYLLTIKENYVSGSETYTYYSTALINIPNYNFKCQTTFIPYLSSISDEFKNVIVNYNGSGNLTLVFDSLDDLSYTFYNCLRLSD